MTKYSKLDLAKQLKKDSTLYTWANAKSEDAGIHALLVRKGYLYCGDEYLTFNNVEEVQIFTGSTPKIYVIKIKE